MKRKCKYYVFKKDSNTSLKTNEIDFTEYGVSIVTEIHTQKQNSLDAEMIGVRLFIPYSNIDEIREVIENQINNIQKITIEDAIKAKESEYKKGYIQGYSDCEVKSKPLYIL